MTAVTLFHLIKNLKRRHIARYVRHYGQLMCSARVAMSESDVANGVLYSGVYTKVGICFKQIAGHDIICRKRYP